MSRSRGEHGAGPERLVVADATSGQFAVPTFAHRFAVVSALDEEDGAPIIRKEDEILLDWKQVRVHDLQQDAKPGVRDRRLQLQIVNDYDASVEPPKDGMSPYAQAEVWTALNRSTREADGFGRVALPGSHRRIVGSEDGKFAIAQTLVEWQAAATGEVGGPPPNLPPPAGVVIRQAGVTTGNGGAVETSQPTVTVNGVTVFGTAGVAAAQDAINAGASPSEILAAAQSGFYTPTLADGGSKVAIATEVRSPAPAARPGGYVVNEAKKVGLLGTLLTPALGEAVFAGREGEEIGVLPLRADAQIAASKEKRGRLHLKTDDVANLPEDTKSQRVKGWLMFDSSLAGQDSKIPGDLGQWRPVVPVTAAIPPSRDPPPPPPPPKPKGPIGFIPGGGQPPGPDGSKGKAELYLPGGSSGQPPPSTPPKETGDGLAGGDLTPVGVLTGAGGGTPEGGVVAGGGGAGGVRAPGGGSGEGPVGVISGPVANPQSQKRDLSGEFVDPVPCPLTTSGGEAVAVGSGGSSAPEGSTEAGDGPLAPIGPSDGGAVDDPPGGFQPDPSGLPETFYEPGFPAIQVVGNEVWLGGSRSGSGPSGHPVKVKGDPVDAPVSFGSHNVLTTPIPVMGQPGGPTNVEDELAWIAYAAESMRRVLMGMVGGPEFLASNIAVVHQNGPGNPPAGSTIGGDWSAAAGENLAVPSAFTVPGSLHADAGGSITRTGVGVLAVERGHSGDGTIVDQSPLLHLDNRTRGEAVSTADALSTHDRRAAITGGAQVLSSGLVAHRTPDETRDPFEIATVTKADAGRNPAPGSKDFIAWVPLSSQVLAATRGFMATKLYDGGQGGGLLMAPSDETTYVDDIPLRTRGGQLLIAEDPNGLGTVGGFSLTRRGTGTTVLSMTDSEVGNSRSRIEVDVLDPEAIVMVPLAAAPAELSVGPGGSTGFWARSSDGRPMWCEGNLGTTSHRALAYYDELGGGGLTSPVGPTDGGTGITTYATGDLLYASAANTLAKRAIGTSGQVLTVSGGVPTWATPPAAGLGTVYKASSPLEVVTAVDTDDTVQIEDASAGTLMGRAFGAGTGQVSHQAADTFLAGLPGGSTPDNMLVTDGTVASFTDPIAFFEGLGISVGAVNEVPIYTRADGLGATVSVPIAAGELADEGAVLKIVAWGASGGAADVDWAGTTVAAISGGSAFAFVVYLMGDGAGNVTAWGAEQGGSNLTVTATVAVTGADDITITCSGTIYGVGVYRIASEGEAAAGSPGGLGGGGGLTIPMNVSHRWDAQNQDGLRFKITSGKVEEWQDVRDTGHTLSQTTAGDRPILSGTGSTSKVTFDRASGDYLFNTSALTPNRTSGELWAVFTCADPSTSPDHCIFAACNNGAANRFFEIYVYNSKIHIYWQNAGTADELRADSTTINADETYIIHAMSNGTTTRLWINNVEETLTVVTGANSGNWWGDVSSVNRTSIGAYIISSGAGGFFDGDIHEIVINDSLNFFATPEDRTAMYGYLQTRWGL